MKINPKPIIVFEHTKLMLSREDPLFKALQQYHGNGSPYFELMNKGVKFKEYVGVIQVGNQVIEVLPKADKNLEKNGDKWRSILIDMLRSVNRLKAEATSDSKLNIKSSHILDLYFELFIEEVEKLLHHGLIKSYRKIDSNLLALKGRIKFAQHITVNLIHQERFFVRHTTYDNEHLLHKILYKTLGVLKRINTNTELTSRIGNLLLNFPEMPDLKVDANLFTKVVYGRKNGGYQKSIEIAKMILLQYHPDLSNGRNNVLALMFDMNVLWEEFILATLKKAKHLNFNISAQPSRNFWKPHLGYKSRMRPDIWIKLANGEHVILDTKWKNLNGYNPSAEDLRQMYVYHEYFDAKKVALLYPGSPFNNAHGSYYLPNGIETGCKQCSVLCVEPEKDIKHWQTQIVIGISDWINGQQLPSSN